MHAASRLAPASRLRRAVRGYVGVTELRLDEALFVARLESLIEPKLQRSNVAGPVGLRRRSAMSEPRCGELDAEFGG